ncbi:hypothetical protein TNCV_1458531 [Trichonephila clavipes]|nr:hypothetical protein TNCV_1458531 [Trichonephila clavipes]
MRRKRDEGPQGYVKNVVYQSSIHNIHKLKSRMTTTIQEVVPSMLHRKGFVANEIVLKDQGFPKKTYYWKDTGRAVTNWEKKARLLLCDDRCPCLGLSLIP